MGYRCKKLSATEKRILKLEVKKRELYKQYGPMPNNKTRRKLWEKDHKIGREQRGLLYAGGWVKPELKRIIYKSGKKRNQLMVELLKCRVNR